MPPITAEHFRHHWRFYAAFLLGVAAAGALIGKDGGFRVAVGGIAFFVVYLGSTAWLGRHLTVEDLREKAQFEDEGIGLIVLITLGAIALSLGSLALLLGRGNTGAIRLAIAVVNVPLGWATLHTVMAFHYAHLFYGRDEKREGKPGDAGGLDFPKTAEPSVMDFIYYSFVVGMTAQVSDVDITSRKMRRTTTVHGVVSFFFNTVILAFAVNVLTRG